MLREVLAGGGHRSRSLSRSRSNRRCLSNSRRLASNASSVVSATSVERPRSIALSISSRCLAIYSLHSSMRRSVSTRCLRSSSVTAFPTPHLLTRKSPTSGGAKVEGVRHLASPLYLAEPIDRNPNFFLRRRANLRYVLRTLEEQILQHHSIVIRLVMRGEHQRDPTALRKRT